MSASLVADPRVVRRAEPRLGPAVGHRRGAVAATALVTTAGLAAFSGGYFPRAWGLSAFVLFGVAALALLLRAEVSLAPLELAFLAGLASLTVWIAISMSWSASGSQSLLEVQRALVYVAAAAGVLLVARRGSTTELLAGIAAAATLVSAYALATRLFPDRVDTYDPVALYRLSEPIGYWNALGILAAMGALLAFAFAARAGSSNRRALAAASLVVLLPTIYFTYGRGPIVALALGLVAMVALDSRRRELATTLLVVAPALLLAVWLCSRSEALTRQQSPLADAAQAGHSLAPLLLALAALAAASTLALGFVARRWHPPSYVAQAYGGVLLLSVAVALLVVFLRFGSPPTLVAKAYDAFRASPVRIEGGTDLNERLLSLSSNGRIAVWKASWRDYREHPALGSGAGSFERYWNEHRPTALKVRDAHSLYLETLAELGPLGLALLALTLGIPLIAGLRTRRHPLMPAAGGAYLAFVAHAGIDWDWEVPAVVVTGLLCGAGLLVAARSPTTRPFPARVRAGGFILAAALAAFALVGLIGNGALAASADATTAGEWDRADREARKAIRWMPWSAEAWEQLAEAQLGKDDLDAARESYRRAIAKDAGDWSLWLNFGLLSEGEQRRRAFAHAVRLNPLSPRIAIARSALRRQAALEKRR